MWLFVGLGNPGEQYARNRHNIGFMAAEAIARRHDFSGWKKKFQAEIAEGTLAGEKVLLLKPQTYMNLSGDAVQAAAAFYKISPENIIVLYDEIDLAPGKLRVKTGGGSGGHNGIRSIDSCLGPEYHRVRIGVGHPGDKDMVSPYVLGNFAKADAVWLEPLLDAVAEHAPLLLDGGEGLFMTRVAQAVPAPEKEETEQEKKETNNGL